MIKNKKHAPKSFKIAAKKRSDDATLDLEASATKSPDKYEAFADVTEPFVGSAVVFGLPEKIERGLNRRSAKSCPLATTSSRVPDDACRAFGMTQPGHTTGFLNMATITSNTSAATALAEPTKASMLGDANVPRAQSAVSSSERLPGIQVRVARRSSQSAPDASESRDGVVGMPMPSFTAPLKNSTMVLKIEMFGSGSQNWGTRSRVRIPPRDRSKVEDSNYPAQIVFHKNSLTKIADSYAPKFTYSIAGPQSLGGSSDSGPNSIDQNVMRGNSIVKNTLQYLPLNTKLIINGKGHSRGGVALSRLTLDAINKVRAVGGVVSMVYFDPVPGPFHRGVNKKIDVSSADDSAVIYSVHTQYSIGFTPQLVSGAQRYILSNQDHSAGVRGGFWFEGVLYKGSGINKLPKGIYIGVSPLKIRTEGGIKNIEEGLEKSTLEEAAQYLENVSYNHSFLQNTRREVIKKSIRSCKAGDGLSLVQNRLGLRD